MPSSMEDLKELVETQFDFLRNMGLKVLALDKAESARLETKAAEKGKADFTLNGEILDAHGTVIAAIQGFYQLRKY